MNIINKVNDTSYIQWVETFVSKIIKKAKLSCKEVVIEDIEFSQRIYLSIDGQDYTIRTWNFRPLKTDDEGRPCAEMVDYTLFIDISDGNGCGHGEALFGGSQRIDWKN